MSTTAAGDPPLIFDWTPSRPRKRAIGTFILVSVLAHALCFYVFQVVYPPSVALLPPAARVNLISAASEDGRALLQRIEAEDPALTMTTMRPPDSRTYALPKVEHVPSYSQWVPKMRELPPPTPDLSIPSAAAPGPVRLPHSATPPISAAPHRTGMFVSEELESLGAPRTPQMRWTTSLLGAPENIGFRVAVDRFGAVRYCLPTNSSGDATLDEQARNFIVASHFDRATSRAEQDTWGVLTIEWGNDVQRAAATTRP